MLGYMNPRAFEEQRLAEESHSSHVRTWLRKTLSGGKLRPPQAIDAKVTNEISTAHLHLEALKELAERARQGKLARQAQEAMIDVTPVKPVDPLA